VPEPVAIQPDIDIMPGSLQVVRARPNLAGGIDQLFLIKGDAVDLPATRLIARSSKDVPPAIGPNEARTLRVFHFNDLHNHLTDLSGEAKGTHRFSQMVKRVGDARRDQPNDEVILFLSIGDDHTGAGFDELLGWTEEQFVSDASYRVYSAAGVDCSVLGNHEFDRGSLLLAKGIRQDAKFPILSANVHSSSHLEAGADYFPAAIAVIKGLRIGMIGLTTRVETKVGQPGDLSLAVASPVDVISNMLPAIEPHVDVMLILSHCGYGDGEHKSGKAAAVRDIGEADFAIVRAARRLTEKPLFILGSHTHTVINEHGLEDNNIFDDVPILQAGGKGRYIGELELNFTADATCEIGKACLHAIKPNIEGNVDCEQPGDYDAEFEANHIEPLIAQIADNLSCNIAQVNTKALSFDTAVLDRYAGESALLNFMCDAIHSRMNGAQYEVDFCLLNGATALAGIEPGNLTLGGWFDVMPYADQVFIVTMNGAALEAIFQNNARRILRPEEIANTDYQGFLPRGFVHTSKHIRYGIELGHSAGQARAFSIEINGIPIASLADHKYKVAMPTYLALGAFGERWNGQSISGGVPGDLDGFDMRVFPAKNTGQIYRNQISASIQAAGVLDERANVDGRLMIVSNKEEAV
jgi:5'-nucleotidase/UDP-sugar diphosphatase